MSTFLCLSQSVTRTAQMANGDIIGKFADQNKK